MILANIFAIVALIVGLLIIGSLLVLAALAVFSLFRSTGEAIHSLDDHPFWSTRFRGITVVNMVCFAFFLWFYQYLEIEALISLLLTLLSIISIDVLLYKYVPRLFDIEQHQ